MRPACSQAYHTACHYGAVGTLAAVFNRAFTGEGQHVDISMQESLGAISEHSNMYYIHDNIISRRRPNEHVHGPGSFKRFPCQNGWVEITVQAGPRWEGMVSWMAEEGMAENLQDPRWQDPEYRKDHLTEAYPIIERWLKTHTKEEVFHGGQRRRLPWGSVNTISEIVHDKHLKERGFFVQVEHAELGRELTYPGAPYILHESPWAMRRPAPRIGEHNVEVYINELGLSKSDLVVLKEDGVI